MIERLLIATLLVAALFGAITLVRLWLRRRDRRIVRRLRAAALDGERHDGEVAPRGVPRIVYFTTRSCEMCRVMQEPALDRLAREFGPVVIEQHDAIEQAALAAEYGVFSTPTTAVYDRHDRLVTINRGFADVDRLVEQLQVAPAGDGTMTVAAAG